MSFPETSSKNQYGIVVESWREQNLNPNYFNVPTPFFSSSKNKRRKVLLKSQDFVKLHSDYKEFILLSYKSLIDISAVFPKIDDNVEQRTLMGLDDLITLCAQYEQSLNRYLEFTFQETELTGNENILDNIFGKHFKSITNCTIKFNGRSYYIPSNSSFSISSMDYLPDWLNSMDPFDLIIADPPWPNASASRSGQYKPIDIYDLFKIPIKSCLSENGFLCMWVTNNPKINKFVKYKLFPDWGLQVVSTWYWIKVTNTGEMVIPLDSTHRKPYEILYVGRRKDFNGPKNFSIISIPGSHSRKPPLREMIKSLALQENSRNLELFSRSTRENFTCWGNETIKFNDSSFFNKV